ncbi:MAG: SIMPL domain-containing protein [Alphaproteobacteria bacterium]|nr:SIMPL domain-containing protein [Alphaproteobacteria bacterium]
MGGPVLEKGQTLVTLSANDQKQVEQDELNASLRIEIEDTDARVVQDKINKAMRSAVDLAKKNDKITVTTGQYYVYSYDPNPQPKIVSMGGKKIMKWRGSQTIDLKSRDSQAVLDLVASVQGQGFVMNGLNYSLSEDVAEDYQDSLLQGALKKIQDKASLVTKSLGKSGFDIIEVNVNGSYMPSPMPMVRGMAKMEMMSAASDDMSTPVAEPGKSTVSMSVSARVILKP